MPNLRCYWLPACLFCLATGVLAEPFSTPGDNDLQRQRQEQLLREQRQRLEELQQLPGKAPTEAPASTAPDTRCFTIRTITLEGAEHLDERAREALLAPYRNRCLGVNQLNELLKGITDHYLSRGFVTTRAYLPQQDLSKGELKIIVVEGRFEGFDQSELASPRELAMTFPGHTGDVLNLRDLEQLVDQINRLPSRQAQMELVPGKEVGGSRVQLKGERSKPWRVSASRDNNGDSTSGEQQAGVGLDWDSPLGLADQFGLRAGQDVVSDHWKHSDNQSLWYSVPYGWWTFNYSYSRNYYRTRNEDSGFAFKYDGDNETHQLGAERVIHRDDVSKTAINFGLKVLSDSFSSDNLKQMAIASLTGGLTAEYFNSLSGADTHTKIVGGKTVADLSSWGGVGSFAASQGMQNFTSTALSQALDQGGSFGDALKNSLYNTFAAAGFNQVGDIGAINGYAPGSAPMVAMHALMGGLASVVSGGDFATGAVAAGANEAMVASLDGTFKKLSPDQREQLLTTSSQLVGLVATAAVIQNASTDQLETGVWAAKNSTQYNYLFHEELDEMARKIQGCGKDTDCKDRIGLSYAELDQQRNNAFPSLCQSDLAACGKIAARLMAEDPQNVELALSLHKAQTVGLEAVISTNYIQSNRMAMDTATSEYLAQTGGTTELLKMALAQSAAGGLIGGSGSSFNKLVAKGASEAAAQIPGRVQSRINIADGRTATTPLRDNGNPVSAGFDHVLKGHFDVEVSNSRSVFTVSPSELKGILQSSSVVKSPVTAMPDGQFVRTVDVGRVIGTSTLKDGGVPTSVIKVFTDRAGNLITAFPVKAPN